jgi:outer membrane protein assembly factor BamB
MTFGLLVLILFLITGTRTYLLTLPKTSFPLNLKWKLDLGFSSSDTPVYQDGRFIFSTYSIIGTQWYSIDPGTGKVEWIRAASRGDVLRCLTQKYLILSSKTGNNGLLALNNPGTPGIRVLVKQNGELAWEQDISYAQTCSESLVFASGSRGDIGALDIATGQTIWWGTKPHINHGRLMYNPETEELIAEYKANTIHFIDPLSGRILRSQENSVFVSDKYLIDRGELFVGTGILDAGTGQLIHEMPFYRDDAPPTVTEDTIYISGGGIVALDRGTYKLKWLYQPQDENQWIPRSALSPMTILDEKGYVITSDGALRAIDLDTGQELGYWQLGPIDLFKLPYCTTLPPVPNCIFLASRVGLSASQNTLVVSFGDGKLYAFSREQSPEPLLKQDDQKFSSFIFVILMGLIGGIVFVTIGGAFARVIILMVLWGIIVSYIGWIVLSSAIWLIYGNTNGTAIVLAGFLSMYSMSWIGIFYGVIVGMREERKKKATPIQS